MANTDSNKLKVKEPETIEDIELPILPQWEGIINRPTSLSDLDQTAQDEIDNANSMLLTLGDLAYLNSITKTEITDGAVTTPKIFAGAVTASKISVGSLSAINANIGAITAGTIDGVTITGGTVRTSASGARVQMLDSTNTLQILDNGGTVRAESFADGIEFSRSSGAVSGRVYDDGNIGSFVMLGLGRNIGIITNSNQVELGTANLGLQLNEATNSIRSNGDLEPWLDASDNLGTNSTRWAIIYGDAIDANNSIKLNGVTINNWTDIASGGANTNLNNLTTTSINKSLIPSGTTQDLGRSSRPWDRLHISKIDCDGAVQLSGGGYIDNARAIYLETGRTHRASISGEIRYHDGVSKFFECYVNGFRGSIDLTAS